jgi:hypothetical protein
MFQDDRTNEQALAGLFDSDMLNSSAFSRAAPEVESSAAPAPAERLSVLEQMDERHGKLKSRLGLFSHLYSGGDKSGYGDADLKTAHKVGLLSDQFDGIDINNPTMAQVATLAQLDPGLGKVALENFSFGQRVSDLGRAQGFMNDGIDDENDLWAAETYGRYGKTSGGATGAVSAAADSLGISAQEFLELPAEVQETALYNMGDEGYRKSADVLGGRDLETLENKAQATKQGDSIGAIDGASIEYMHNASSVDFDQTKAMENADAIISMLENDELNTGKWQQWFKDTTGITTRADGTLGAAATENLIKQINSATFGALSEKEIEQLMQTFAQGGQSKEFNLGTMDMVKKKLKTAQEKHTKDTQRAADRIKDNNPEEYERFMRDDDNYLRYGGGKDRAPVTMSGGGEMSYEAFYRDGIAQGRSRDQIDVAFNNLAKREEAAIKEQERIAAEEAKLAEQARKEMQARGEHLSPYIRRQ